MSRKLYPSADPEQSWKEFDFRAAQRRVNKLQKRIAIALANCDLDKAERLMIMLTHSFDAKMLSVRSVCNKRDNKAIESVPCGERRNLTFSLKARGYRSDAVVYKEIPKPDGGVRVLSIPTIRDRAMQTLYRMALEPVSEFLADEHSYGFRPNRRTQDAIVYCLDILNDAPQPQFILEGDIHRCFDNICRSWIMDNIPLEKKVLKQFLHRRHIKDGKLFPVYEGIAQGSCISPMICNMVLDGMEPLLKSRFGERVQFIRYADDFVVISVDRSLLENLVTTALEDFLSERGLHLSRAKTTIAHIDDGFDFLGWHVQRYGNRSIAVPSAKNVASLMDKVRMIMYTPFENRKQLENKLQSVVRGWVLYHRGIVPPTALYEIEYDLISLIINTCGDKNLAALASSLFALV